MKNLNAVKKGQIVNVNYKGVEEFAEVLNVNKYVGYTRVLTAVLTDNGRVKNTFDLSDILSIHSN